MPVASRIALAALVLAASAGAAAAECRSEAFADNDYVICRFDLPEDDLRIFWKDPAGRVFGTFTALAGHLEGRGERLAFATNGGMYGTDYAPIGLYVEEGEQLAAANTTSADPDVRPIPNFYKEPNGIFFVAADGSAGVMETRAFLAAKPEVRFATQSGPMLLVDGEIHPMFIPGSSDLNNRNGICAPTPTSVAVVVTGGRANFHDFAVLFRDHLGCRDALFLDGGSASALYSPELGRNDGPGHGGFGPIIGVVVPAPGN